MPGILPMKVIKVGNSAQSRIAQACDRCRSKKIRCDGVRPTCSQCANVGFECRTSDKLSRRAFPRGYTESLEERVRQLEAEARELKDLLDGKDEKIDMLSAMYDNLRPSPSLPDSPATPVDHQPPAREDLFRVQAPPLLLGLESSDAWLMGPSSGRSLITSLKRKLYAAGRPCTDFDPDAFLHVQGCPPLPEQEPDLPSSVPPRLFSDRCVNVFFQEWAPLFPVVHKPTFLRVYEEFVASPDKTTCNFKLAQLHLVYSIAGLSSESPDYRQVAACERQWTKALDALLCENSMNTLQCLILALLYYTIRGDHKRLQHHKSIAVGLSQRLGLHQSQKRFSFGALTLETRKKVFWVLYTLDCFTAATMGLPKLLNEGAIETEYPSDTDDEYITERGFQPTLPGESTRLSCALALFRASRILARVLESLYPTSANHELSLQKLRSLEGELDAWYAELPSHLRLNFVQGKPSTDVTGSRSPFLALSFYYIRTLIYRPAVGSTLGPKAAPALLSIAESSKHTIQIMQLLEQRNMSFSFCLNKHDLLAVCGATLLYQVADLKQDGKLTREVGRLVSMVINMLVGAKAPGCLDLGRAARSLVSVDTGTGPSSTPARQGSMSTPSQQAPSLLRALNGHSGGSPSIFQHPFASGRDRLEAQDKGRRMTEPFLSAHEATVSRGRIRPSLDSSLPRDKTGMGDGDTYPFSMAQCTSSDSRAVTSRSIPNLDYLSMNNTPSQTQPPSPTELARVQAPGSIRPQAEHVLTSAGEGADKMSRVTTADWEALLGSMDGGLNNVYDAIYGGASLINEASLPRIHNPQVQDWSPDSWDLSGFSLGEHSKGTRGVPQSVPSTSDESLSSGEEVAPSELGLSVGSARCHKQIGRCGSGNSFGADRGQRFQL